jgi:short-subunit dehydrogenase
MRIVIVSATSLIAQNVVKVWAQKGDHEFVLVGRSLPKLEAVARDLSIRFPSSNFESVEIDFQSTESIGAVVSKISSSTVDMVLIAQGSLTDQPSASADLVYLKQQLELNAISVALVAEEFAKYLERQGRGTLGIIGSVAGDRGRAYNYSYGASKALIEVYCQGLQQRFAKTNVSVSLIKPGPTATPMTVNHNARKATPESVARIIVHGLEAKRRVIYAPSSWKFIMFVVRNIPFAIFKHLSF